MTKVILGLPKGSLQEKTFALMKNAGFTVRARSSSSYVPHVDDAELEIRLIRAQEMSRYVEIGMLDAGMTGYDWIVENGSDVHEVADLIYARTSSKPVRWVLAVPNDSDIHSAKDLQGKRIATEAVGLAKKYLADHGVEAEVEFSWGATEVKAPELVDAIIELTETGNSLRANDLRIVDTLLESTTKLIANKTSWADSAKRAKIESIALLLQAALAAESKVLLKMNTPAASLEAILDVLPSMRAPTISRSTHDDWHSVETVVDQSVVRDLIPKLKAAGAEGILEIGLNKVVP